MPPLTLWANVLRPIGGEGIQLQLAIFNLLSESPVKELSSSLEALEHARLAGLDTAELVKKRFVRRSAG